MTVTLSLPDNSAIMPHTFKRKTDCMKVPQDFMGHGCDAVSAEGKVTAVAQEFDMAITTL